jgi:tetratricopeptide (TPR) repeat protein
MRKEIIMKLTVGTTVSLMFIIAGCTIRSELGPEDYATDGWQMVAEQDYRAAIEEFLTAADMDPEYTDAWNGLGWAFGKLGQPDTSIVNFTIGAELNDPTVIGVEILAGRSFSSLALGEFSDVISDAKQALTRSPIWVFRRDPSFTYQHLTLNVATAFFGLGHFDSSLVWVQRVAPAFHVDVSTLPGRSQLAIKLEALEDEF